ncbi:DNA-binding NtrC family response regulator [Sphaerotilus hippei]|uniref:DNA-binding NtrC family response regulator n=1 Tax=Sphaerotilus hippei TaxID=744406 RepID=A0A318GZK7_9BURK|nr:sigma-54 dependent transcriptional regulator [Sphaerotilus hippei]PXW95778.1 DNA-binding NtrC family response regulator [Sphaerotilus hippei]
MSGPDGVAEDRFGEWAQCSILVVDDEPGMVSFLQRALAARGTAVDTAGSVEQAMPRVAGHRHDVVLLDIALPGRSGVQWLHELREQGYAGEVILMTAYADLDTAIDALRAGASDFLLKPFSLAQVLNAIQRCLERSRLLRENFVLRRQVSALSPGLEGLVGESEAMRQAAELIQRVAPLPTTVLLLGESGTGKELAARAVHRLSPRARGPFVPVNCAAIAPELIESELFGHVKGAYTGAAHAREGLFYYARGGTLFLDEIAEMPLALQGRLLRVLEERRIRPVGGEQEVEVDVRVVAATNRDLGAEVAAGRFRADLYHRIRVAECTLPPLRERTEDIPRLLAHFVAQLSQQLGLPPIELSPAALHRLQAYDWPGNVRELKNLVERSLIMGYLVLDGSGHGAATAGEPAPAASTDSLDLVEKQHCLRVLEAAGGNKSEAARRLGISRKTLERKCLAWGVA